MGCKIDLTRPATPEGFSREVSSAKLLIESDPFQSACLFETKYAVRFPYRNTIRWIDSLGYNLGTRIAARIKHFERGYRGDSKPLKYGVYEARIHTGPGIRLYFLQEGASFVILHAGSKASQQADILESIRRADLWRKRAETM